PVCVKEAPYFPFWAKDWRSSESVQLMSLAERGAFVELLTIAWLASEEPCTIPSDETKQAVLLRISPREWRKLAPRVLAEFEAAGSGRLRNAKLYKVYSEMQAKHLRHSEGGKQTAAKRWNHDSPANSLATEKLVTARVRVKDKDRVLKKGEAAPSPFSQADCNALYERWTLRRGAVKYPVLRNAFLPLYPASGARHELADLLNAIDAFSEAASAAPPEYGHMWNVAKFVGDVNRWIRLGKMQPMDEWGELTERG